MYISEGLFQYGVFEKLKFSAFLLMLTYSFLQKEINAFDELSMCRKDFFFLVNQLAIS